MKRNCITFLICTLLSVLVADAATVYFQNTKNWNAVYAYTWSPSDEPTILDALQTVTVKDADGGDMTLYVKETNKENIIFLNKSSYLSTAKDKEQTVQFKVVDGSVYTGSDTQIGTVVDKDGVLTFIDETPVEYESGLFLAYGTKGEFTDETEFIKAGSVYSINSIELPANVNVKIYYKQGDSNDIKQVGPVDDNYIVSGTNVYSVGFNENTWTTEKTGHYFDITFNAEDNKVTFESLKASYWGVFRSDAGVWEAPVKFDRPNPDVAEFVLDLDAGENSQFALFRTFGNQSWTDGTRQQPKESVEIISTYSGKYEMGNSRTWMLDNEVPFGSWKVNVIHGTLTISFTRNVQAIIVNGTPAELTDGSWNGALAEDDVVDFNIDGTYYVLGELTQKQEGTNLIYTTTLVEGRDKEIGFSADDATITVDGLNVTITATGAFKPQMTVGAKTIDLAQSGNFLVAYGVDITNDDAISFSINGKNYIPEMPESIKYEAFSVTLPLKEEDGSVTFADVKGTSGRTPFITDTFVPNIRVKDDASAVTFIWDVETGVDGVNAENDCVATYYNLQGVRVSNPENGLYIKVVDGKATKVRL